MAGQRHGLNCSRGGGCSGRGGAWGGRDGCRCAGMCMCIHCGREHIRLHMLTRSFPPSIGIIVNTVVLPLSEANALLCCPTLLGRHFQCCAFTPICLAVSGQVPLSGAMCQIQ